MEKLCVESVLVLMTKKKKTIVNSDTLNSAM